MSSGKVVFAKDLFYTGNTIFINHGMGVISLYAHLQDVLVTPGQAVKKGEKIALSGKTGRITGPHLHWTVSLNNQNIDPMRFLIVSEEFLKSRQPSTIISEK